MSAPFNQIITSIRSKLDVCQQAGNLISQLNDLFSANPWLESSLPIPDVLKDTPKKESAIWPMIDKPAPDRQAKSKRVKQSNKPGQFNPDHRDLFGNLTDDELNTEAGNASRIVGALTTYGNSPLTYQHISRMLGISVWTVRDKALKFPSVFLTIKDDLPNRQSLVCLTRESAMKLVRRIQTAPWVTRYRGCYSFSELLRIVGKCNSPESVPGRYFAPPGAELPSEEMNLLNELLPGHRDMYRLTIWPLIASQIKLFNTVKVGQYECFSPKEDMVITVKPTRRKRSKRKG